MQRIPGVLRTLLGLAFVVFGLNYFLEFLPQPKSLPPEVIGFMGPFIGAKYLGLIKTIEIGSGLLLIGNRFVPLALTLLAPILVGITWFHLQLEPSGLPLPIILVALEVALAYFYRDAFAPMLQPKAEPRRSSEPAPARVAVTAR